MKKLLLLAIITLSAVSLNAQWQQTSCPMGTGDGIMNITTNGNSVFTCVDGPGVYFSPDNGSNWGAANTGLTASYYTSFAVNGSSVFLGTDVGIFRTDNNGSNWSLVNSGLTTTFVSCLANNASNVYAGAGLCHLFYSGSNGSSWSEISNGLPTDISISSLIFSFSFKGSEIYTGTGEGVYKSTNNGQNWYAANNGIIDFNVVSALANIGDNILAGTDNGLYLSNDSGNNWSPVNLGFSYISINSFAKDGSTLFMGTEKGVFKSTDNGLLWDSINTGFTDHNIQTLAINGTYLFANERTTGIWRRPLSELQGIEDNIVNLASVLYPNPSEGKFTINNIHSINLIEVFNTLGEQVYMSSNYKQQTQQEIDLSYFPKGIYFVKIYETEKPHTVKIVIK